VCYTFLSSDDLKGEGLGCSGDQGDESKETCVLVSHRPIYRTPLGYSFSRKIDKGDYDLSSTEGEEEIEETVPVPSLTTYCSWFLSANQRILQEQCQRLSGSGRMISEEMAHLIEETKELGSLWHLRYVPAPAKDSNTYSGGRIGSQPSSYPTLTYLIQRNKEIFKFPVISS
jgi:hypothetical protein